MNSEDFNEEVDADVAEQAFNDAQAILQAKQGIHKEQEEQMDTGSGTEDDDDEDFNMVVKKKRKNVINVATGKNIPAKNLPAKYSTPTPNKKGQKRFQEDASVSEDERSAKRTRLDYYFPDESSSGKKVSSSSAKKASSSSSNKGSTSILPSLAREFFKDGYAGLLTRCYNDTSEIGRHCRNDLMSFNKGFYAQLDASEKILAASPLSLTNETLQYLLSQVGVFALNDTEAREKYALGESLIWFRWFVEYAHDCGLSAQYQYRVKYLKDILQLFERNDGKYPTKPAVKYALAQCTVGNESVDRDMIHGNARTLYDQIFQEVVNAYNHKCNQCKKEASDTVYENAANFTAELTNATNSKAQLPVSKAQNDQWKVWLSACFLDIYNQLLLSTTSDSLGNTFVTEFNRNFRTLNKRLQEKWPTEDSNRLKGIHVYLYDFLINTMPLERKMQFIGIGVLVACYVNENYWQASSKPSNARNVVTILKAPSLKEEKKKTKKEEENFPRFLELGVQLFITLCYQKDLINFFADNQGMVICKQDQMRVIDHKVVDSFCQEVLSAKLTDSLDFGRNGLKFRISLKATDSKVNALDCKIQVTDQMLDMKDMVVAVQKEVWSKKTIVYDFQTRRIGLVRMVHLFSTVQRTLPEYIDDLDVDNITRLDVSTEENPSVIEQYISTIDTNLSRLFHNPPPLTANTIKPIEKINLLDEEDTASVLVLLGKSIKFITNIKHSSSGSSSNPSSSVVSERMQEVYGNVATKQFVEKCKKTAELVKTKTSKRTNDLTATETHIAKTYLEQFYGMIDRDSSGEKSADIVGIVVTYINSLQEK